MNRNERDGARQLAALGAGLIVLTAGWASAAEHWTRFRGPNGSGHGGDFIFPDQWADQDYAWKIRLPGVGHSSPVGWDNLLLVTSGDPDSGAMTLQCLNAASGDEIWQKQFSGEPRSIHDGNSYASSTPTIDSRRIYVTHFGEQEAAVTALSHAGEQLWRRPLGVFIGRHGFGASPIVADGIVCVQVELADRGFAAGLNAETGELRWQVERPASKASYATPCLVEFVQDGAPRKALIINSTSGGIQAADLKTGDLLWKLDSIFPHRCVSSPTVAGQLILGTSGGGGIGKQLAAVKASPDGNTDPTIALQLERELPYVPTPIIDGDRLYLWLDRGIVRCLDLSSGKSIWTKRVGGNYFGSPILVGGKIYCMSRGGEAVVVAAGEKFKLLGKTDLGEPSHSTPAVHNGRLYLRTESTLACLDAETRQAARAPRNATAALQPGS